MPSPPTSRSARSIAALGEMDADALPVLLDALEGVAEMVVRGIDGLAQQPLQPVPGGQDLPQRALADDAPLAVDGDALFDLDAEIARAGAAFLQRLQQFGMGGDAGAAADQLDRRALEHVDVPADPAQERGGEQARHRAADDDGAPAAALRRSCHGYPGLGCLDRSPEMIAGTAQRSQRSSSGMPMSPATAMMAKATRR